MKNFDTKQRLKKYPEWIQKMKNRLEGIKIPSKVIFIVLGVISSAWFLIRVIPKPSRATYPCMKVAAPFMSSFVIWLIGLSASFLAFKKAREFIKNNRYLLASLMIVSGLIAGGLFLLNNSAPTLANTEDIKAEHLTANDPMGMPKGVVPGRVVWVHDKDATNENCTNDPGVHDNDADDDGYFLPKNNDQGVIDKMLFDALTNLSNQGNVADAWDAMFKYFNNKKYGSETGYVSSQTIFIKINTTSASWVANKSTLDWPAESYANWKWNNYGIAETTPATMLTILRQLVDSVGVPQDKIYIGDPISNVWEYMYELCSDEYPNVHYIEGDRDGTRSIQTGLGREALTASPFSNITYSDGGDAMPDAVDDKLYMEMTQADYLINLAALKGHERAGITLCAKNHFGSHVRNGAEHLHDGLIAPDNDPNRTDYGIYRVQVDIMASEYLGENTVLHLVDGLWGGPHDTKQPVKWQMAPFNNDWPNSFFVSQDQVALESVCFDFLRTEFDGSFSYPELSSTFDFPNYSACDDYLEQAASLDNWPDGITYSPDGNQIKSLGIHEHWLNSTKKVYSGNLYQGHGIELLAIPGNLVDESGVSIADPGEPTEPGEPSGISRNNTNNDISLYPNPASDFINIQLNNEMKGTVQITIMDITGKKVRSIYAEKQTQSFEKQINISALNAGNYFVSITTENYFAKKQFVVSQ